jgi:2'-5' RNA ligase
VRLFVAVELSQDIKRVLARAQGSLAEFGRMVRWARYEQMHLTLKFLGEVADDRVEQVCSSIESAALGSSPFQLGTRRAGCFPPGGKARVVWVGLAEESGELMDCQRRIEEALEQVGFPRERRPFSPHLTLGRVKDDKSGGRLRDAVAALAIPEVRQTVDSVVLVKSDLLPQGARYTQVGGWPLGGEE